MTRIEYMEKLANALKEYDDDFATDILGDYRRHFDEAAKDGRSEESVCDELGSVEEFIRDIPEEFKKESKERAEQAEERKTEQGAEQDEKQSTEQDRGQSEEQRQSNGESFVDMAGKWVNAAGKFAAEVVGSIGDALDSLGDTIRSYDKKEREDDAVNEDEAEDMFVESEGGDSLLFGRFEGITSLSLGQIYANIEVLTQGDGDELTITRSRAITKKEEMYFKTEVMTSVCESGRKLTISQSSKKGRFGPVTTTPLTLYVHLPASCRVVDLHTVSGDVRFNCGLDKLEKCDVNTVSGKVEAKETIEAKDIAFHSVSGSLHVLNGFKSEQVRLESVSGGIKAMIGAEKFLASTVSGGIKLAFDRACTGKLSTVSGGMKIKLLSDTGMDINSSSMSGSLKLITEQPVTWDGGKNSVDFKPKKSRNAVFGSGGVRLKTSSISGSVKVYDYNVEED